MKLSNSTQIFLYIVFALVVVSCSKDDNGVVSIPSDDRFYMDTPRIIVDVDVASSTDDLFTLQMAYNYDHQGLCQLLGVVVDRAGEKNATCVDVMNTYFGYGDIPLGLVRNGIAKPSVWINYSALPTYTDENNNLLFQRTITDYSQLPDGWQLYRQLLAQQPDHSVSICSVGFLTCLSQLLDSEADSYSPLSGIELVRRKVKCIYIMGGVFGNSNESDFNFAQGISFARNFFLKWPTDVDMVFSPGEVGDGIEYVPEQIVADISWTDAHPIKQIYLNCFTKTGQKMWDPMTIIQAVEGDELFSLSERGNVDITNGAETIFTPSATGNCRYQLPGDAEWCSMMLQKIRNSILTLR